MQGSDSKTNKMTFKLPFGLESDEEYEFRQRAKDIEKREYSKERERLIERRAEERGKKRARQRLGYSAPTTSTKKRARQRLGTSTKKRPIQIAKLPTYPQRSAFESQLF